VALLVLRHVEPDHVVLGVEQRLRERPRQLRLAHAGRAEEEKRADRPARVLDPGPRPDDGVGDELHRLATTTLERMARHAAADVVSIWLMKRRPPTLDAGLPCFPLRLGDEPAVVLPAAWLPASDWPTLPVGAFLDALVDQRLAYRRAPTGLARAELAAIATTCWHCEAPYTAYDRQVSLVCRCGRDLGAPTTRYADQLWRVLAVQAARRALPVRDGHPPATIQQRVLSVRPVGLPEDLASLVARHSRPEPQWVNVCPRCRRTLGPFYLARLPVDEWIDMNLPPELAWGHADGSSGHWCLAPPSGRDG